LYYRSELVEPKGLLLVWDYLALLSHRTCLGLFLLVLMVGLTGCQSTQSTAYELDLEAQEMRWEIVKASDQGVLDSPVWQQALQSSYPEIRRQALQGLARLARPEAAQLAYPFLSHPDARTRQMAAFALGSSASKQATTWLIQAYNQESDAVGSNIVDSNIVDSNSVVKEEIALALATLGGNAAFQFLNQQVAALHNETMEGSLEHSAGAAKGLGHWLTWNQYSQPEIQGLAIRNLLVGSQLPNDQSIKFAFALSRLSMAVSGYTESDLLNAIKNSQNEIAQGLLVKAWSRFPQRENWIELLRLFPTVADPVKIEVVRALAPFSAEPEMYQTLLNAYPMLDDILKAEVVTSLLTDAPEQVMRPVIYQSLLNDNVWLSGLALQWLSRRAPKEALSAAQKINKGAPRWLKLLALDIFTQHQPELLVDQIKRLALWQDDAVRDAYAKEPKSNADLPKRETPTVEQMSRAIGQRIEVETNRGTFVMQLHVETPVIAAFFIEQVNRQGYDGSVFSRVIANFVAQGGDRVGNGLGGAAFLLRDEWTLNEHTQGTIGMASAGKDKIGQQFFINLQPNLHLDRHYTVFAHITSGWDIASRLQMGDFVRTMRLLPQPIDPQPIDSKMSR